MNKDIRRETNAIQEKLAVLFEQLDLGMIFSMPISRSMSGYTGLKELRLSGTQGAVRVFYYIQKGDKVFILHLFRKKSQKTPTKEIKTALQRLRQMKEEFHVE